MDLLLKAGSGGSGPSSRVLVTDGASFLVADYSLGAVAEGRFAVGWGQGVVSCYNAAAGGKTYSQMVSDGAASVDAYFVTTGRQPANVVLHDGGWVNDVLLAGRTIAQSAVYGQQYATDRRTAGATKIYGFYNQATAYDETTLGEVSGDAAARARFLAWETADPGYSANSRWAADHEIDTHPTYYADEWIDWRDGGYWATRFYNVLAYSRYPAYFGNPSQSTSGGKSHPTQVGVAAKFDFAVDTLVAEFALDAKNTLYNGLWAFWPMWTGDASQGGTPTNRDYWKCGVQTIYHANSPTQNSGSVTFGAGSLFNTGYGYTSASSATVAHSVGNVTTPFTWAGWLKPVNLDANGFDAVRGILYITNEFELWFDTTAQRIKFKLYASGAGSSVTVASLTALTIGAEALVTCGYDGTNAWISVNDETRVTSAIASVNTGTANELVVAGGAKGFCAEYHAFGLWRRNLLAAERTYLYNAGVPLASLFADAGPLTVAGLMLTQAASCVALSQGGKLLIDP